MESPQSNATNHTCCGCGKSCRRTTLVYGVSIIILSIIVALIAPSVIMKSGVPLLRIPSAAEEMSIGALGEIPSPGPQQQEIPEQAPNDAHGSADVSVQ